MSRKIVLDTETTGIDVKSGHKIIEIGCVELIDRKLTGNNYHQYLNPQRSVDAGAYAVHGLSEEFLADKPTFSSIADEFLAYLGDAQLVIHNAKFDVGFLQAELKACKYKYQITKNHQIIDTLIEARAKYPGQKNNLDALCQRLGVDNSNRSLHGALLDAQILALVYLAMTGGQLGLGLALQTKQAQQEKLVGLKKDYRGVVLEANEQELAQHQQWLEKFIN